MGQKEEKRRFQIICYRFIPFFFRADRHPPLDQNNNNCNTPKITPSTFFPSLFHTSFLALHSLARHTRFFMFLCSLRLYPPFSVLPAHNKHSRTVCPGAGCTLRPCEQTLCQVPRGVPTPPPTPSTITITTNTRREKSSSDGGRKYERRRRWQRRWRSSVLLRL